MVGGLATLGPDDKPTSTPTIDHVMRYDFRLRKEAADLTNEGFDIAAAIEMAKKNDELRQVYFISPVSLDIHTAASRACAAPGVEKPKAASDPRPPALTSGEPSKVALKRAREQGKKEAESALRKQLAIAPPPGDFGSMSNRAKKRAKQNAKKPLMLTNGSDNDGTGKGKSKGKGKGAGKGDDTFEGKPICFNWNRDVPCKATPCTYAHVCQICKKPDHPKIRHQ